nr:adenosylcobinamide amidohydrolase [Kineosporia sp. R_H_3]
MTVPDVRSGPAPGPAPGAVGGPVAGDPAGAAGVRLVERAEGGRRWPVLLWAPGPGWRMVSTAVVGGGIGPRAWWLNAKVAMDYHHPDPAAHVLEIAAAVGAADGAAGVGEAPGVGMLTAADVTRWTCAQDEGVTAVATVGLGLPVWAAADDATVRRETGTINVLVRLPVALSDAALVNAVVTATEAKTQALVEAGVPGSGTSSDAVCVACPEPGRTPGARVEEYGGPRSQWGLRVARAVHRAVALGTADWTSRHPDGDPHRRWPRT